MKNQFKPLEIGLTVITLALLTLFQGLKAANRGSSIGFSEHLISADFTYPYAVRVGDIDRDGDLDLTVSDCELPGPRGHNDIYWFENQGKGSFVRHSIWSEPRAGRLERHRLADINQDGYLDVVIVDNQHNSLAWFENSQVPRDSSSWTRHVITTDLSYAYDVAVGDLDGDGDLDVVGAAGWREGQEFAWFENNGNFDQEWKKRQIEGEVGETRDVQVADFDGDGDLDVLGTAARKGQVIWYENLGKLHGSLEWKKHVIATVARPIHGQPVDMDGDGDVDVLMSLGMGGGKVPSDLTPVSHKVVWYENVGKPGKGSDWKEHPVYEPFEQAFESVAADIDGDGDLDVVASASGKDGQIAWFQNPGTISGAWKFHLLKEKWAMATQVQVADLDGDHRLDIVGVAERGSTELRWWRNQRQIGHKRSND